MEGVVKMLALCAACLLFVAPLHEFEGESMDGSYLLFWSSGSVYLLHMIWCLFWLRINTAGQQQCRLCYARALAGCLRSAVVPHL